MVFMWPHEKYIEPSTIADEQHELKFFPYILYVSVKATVTRKNGH